MEILAVQKNATPVGRSATCKKIANQSAKF